MSCDMLEPAIRNLHNCHLKTGYIAVLTIACTCVLGLSYSRKAKLGCQLVQIGNIQKLQTIVHFTVSEIHAPDWVDVVIAGSDLVGFSGIALLYQYRLRNVLMQVLQCTNKVESWIGCMGLWLSRFWLSPVPLSTAGFHRYRQVHLVLSAHGWFPGSDRIFPYCHPGLSLVCALLQQNCRTML